eukprot:gb/GECG01009896.1/.p1 GENE.gb/GECG01009896.1/~~gb/GECG01009896.1/.p1  ORF type:complete len:323 (+),score=36.30 gb/GECG01009896.1/:1-969(+)
MSYRNNLYRGVLYGLISGIILIAESASGERNGIIRGKGPYMRVQPRSLSSCDESVWSKDGFIGTFVLMWLSLLANAILGYLLWREHLSKRKAMIKAERQKERSSVAAAETEKQNGPTPRSSSRSSRPDQRLNAAVSVGNPLQQARNNPSEYGLQNVSLSQIYGGSKRGELGDTERRDRQKRVSAVTRDTTGEMQPGGNFVASNATSLNGNEQGRNPGVNKPALLLSDATRQRSSRRTLGTRRVQRRTLRGNSTDSTLTESSPVATTDNTTPSPKPETTTGDHNTSESYSSLDASAKRKAKIKTPTGTESVIRLPKQKPPPPS